MKREGYDVPRTPPFSFSILLFLFFFSFEVALGFREETTSRGQRGRRGVESAPSKRVESCCILLWIILGAASCQPRRVLFPSSAIGFDIIVYIYIQSIFGKVSITYNIHYFRLQNETIVNSSPLSFPLRAASHIYI